MERERGGDHMTAARGAVMWCMLDLTRFHPPAPRVRDLLSYVSPPLSCRPALMCSSFPFTGSRRAQLNNSAQHDRAGERNCSAHSVRHRLPQITGHRESSERHVRLFFPPPLYYIHTHASHRCECDTLRINQQSLYTLQ